MRSCPDTDIDPYSASQLGATRLEAPCWLSPISYPTHADGIIPPRQEDNFVLERSNIVRTWKIRHSGSECSAYEFCEG